MASVTSASREVLSSSSINPNQVRKGQRHPGESVGWLVGWLRGLFSAHSSDPGVHIIHSIVIGGDILIGDPWCSEKNLSGWTVLWILFQTQMDELDELLAEVLSGEGGQLTVQDCLCHVNAIRALIVRVPPCSTLEENQTKGPNIALVAVRLIPNPLRGHVFKCSNKGATHRKGALELSCHTKISDLTRGQEIRTERETERGP
jgi:hypothetical protein